MHAPEALRPKRCADERFWIGEVTTPLWQYNRYWYLAVGEPWNWHEKRHWTDERWRAYVESGRLRTFCGYYDGTPAGYYELARDAQADVEIAYFGLLPPFIGRGLGGLLLTSALEQAWRWQPRRVWVHTCTLDHPSALANYQARGMTIYKTEASQQP